MKFYVTLILSLFPIQNELSVLEFIHAVVETYDRYFESVVSACLYYHGGIHRDCIHGCIFYLFLVSELKDS